MAQAITVTNMLETFDIVRTVLRANTVIASRFKSSQFYEFEPSLKDVRFKDFPYIVISIPQTEQNMQTMGHQVQIKRLPITITMVLEYEARDKFKRYASNVISAIEQGEATFEASRYYEPEVQFNGADVEFIQEQKFVVGTFDLKLDVVMLR